jgi:hypothetical protein
MSDCPRRVERFDPVTRPMIMLVAQAGCVGGP